ncbi:MAG: hypothetical protein LBM93_14000, partial [Oscillospiraceae bacterium]|nr:hypothetical protein [Oscillospiraceae bacterium]
MSDYPRGSEWHRWDLHLHTPQTIKNDQFEGQTTEDKWEKFYSDISLYIGDGSDPAKSIAVVGITDYLSIVNYEKVMCNKRLPNSIKLILPNVEMRILPFGKKTPINLHCIFNPQIADQIENRFFSKLKFSYGGSSYSALRAELIRLGKAIDKIITDDLIAQKKGIENFVLNFDSLSDVFTNDPDLKEKTVIVISNGTNDGLSGMNANIGDNAQTEAIRQNLNHFSDAFFTSNQSDIDFFLGKKTGTPESQVIDECGALKPCIHGSDAHINSKIFEPKEKRYCWIKADPTFNGLKQILFEPEERVYIGELKPEEKSDYQVIESITFIDDKFQEEPIVFSDKLTCIIGGKSTGKSILLHNLANAIDHKQVDDREKG